MDYLLSGGQPPGLMKQRMRNDNVIVLPGSRISMVPRGSLRIPRTGLIRTGTDWDLVWSPTFEGPPRALTDPEFEALVKAVLGAVENITNIVEGRVVREAAWYLGDPGILRVIGNPGAFREALGRATPGVVPKEQGIGDPDLTQILQALGTGGYRLMSIPGVTDYVIGGIPMVRSSRITGFTGNPVNLSLSLELEGGTRVDVVREGILVVDSLVVIPTREEEEETPLGSTVDYGIIGVRPTLIDLLHADRDISNGPVLEDLVLAKLRNPSIRVPFRVLQVHGDPTGHSDPDPTEITIGLLYYYYHCFPHPSNCWHCGKYERVRVHRDLEVTVEYLGKGETC